MKNLVETASIGKRQLRMEKWFLFELHRAINRICRISKSK